VGNTATQIAASSNCIFCASNRKIIWENKYFFAIYDKYPVNKGHVLLIPKEHVASLFDLPLNTFMSAFLALHSIKTILDKLHRPDGYNIGMNLGKAAGQTIDHLHIHIIPRYEKDVEDPTGGVRFVIPHKGNYKKPGFIPKGKIRKLKVKELK
jgi:diadenosine tetraphosphate (Ap4A) HIT family hydrolase